MGEVEDFKVTNPRRWRTNPGRKYLECTMVFGFDGLVAFLLTV